ncbi:MAG: HAD-IA family hydrolase [Deltaproteobacteria bacterium]|nr:HAD-IA family hydrolase [Deltaproteobacteria bacterium]
MKKDLLIFDLDGTLLDSSPDIAWAANKTLEAIGLEPLDTNTVKANIGWGVRPLLERLMPGAKAGDVDRARAVFLEFYGGRLDVESALYSGVMETLDAFVERGKTMAVVTNKPMGLTLPILKSYGLERYFSKVLGGDSLANKKPHPEPILAVLTHSAVEADSAVYIGDSAIDIEAAGAANVEAIGAAYGFRGKDELIGAGCKVIINGFEELQSIIF